MTAVMTDKALRKILSLGAGVQSSTVLLMAERGEIEKPELAIFADTGWEPSAVYTWLSWLEGQTSIPILRVEYGNIRERSLSLKFAVMPLWVESPTTGKAVPLRRQCTREYKIEPITQGIRKHLGVKPRCRVKEKVEQWIGISIDECERMKPSRIPWIEMAYPLIDAGMSRFDCLKWMDSRGYPRPPRSSCIGCPYHGDDFWKELRDDWPDDWQDALDFDRRVRTNWGGDGEAYVHKSLQPLDRVDLSTPEDRGQLSMFVEECEGMCGC